VLRNSPTVIARSEAERSDEAISNLRLPRSFFTLRSRASAPVLRRSRTSTSEDEEDG